MSAAAAIEGKPSLFLRWISEAWWEPDPDAGSSPRAMRAVAFAIGCRVESGTWDVGRGRGRWDWLTVPRIAAIAGYCVRHVQRTLRALEDSGALQVERRQGNSSLYQFVPEVLQQLYERPRTFARTGVDPGREPEPPTEPVAEEPTLDPKEAAEQAEAIVAEALGYGVAKRYRCYGRRIRTQWSRTHHEYGVDLETWEAGWAAIASAFETAHGQPWDDLRHQERPLYGRDDWPWLVEEAELALAAREPPDDDEADDPIPAGTTWVPDGQPGGRSPPPEDLDWPDLLYRVSQRVHRQEVQSWLGHAVPVDVDRDSGALILAVPNGLYAEYLTGDGVELLQALHAELQAPVGFTRA